MSRFSIVAVGAEESSVKDGEIFNDLSELTRFEAKGESEGQGPENFGGCFVKSCRFLWLCIEILLIERDMVDH